MGGLDELVLFKCEEKFSRAVVVLIARGHPDARRDFGLLEEKHAAVIELAENAAPEGNITHDEDDDEEEDGGGYSVRVCRLCQW